MCRKIGTKLWSPELIAQFADPGELDDTGPGAGPGCAPGDRLPLPVGGPVRTGPVPRWLAHPDRVDCGAPGGQMRAGREGKRLLY